MAQPTVKTVQIVDPRIEPQPDPVYDYVIAPTQNQYYRIPASGLSDSSITFNNLTTLGIDRAYLDTFEIELTCDITFTETGAGNASIPNPGPAEWTFDSFPFNKCCEEAHVNINGGAFFSQPLSYVRAKERYMDQAALAKCYENLCPVHKPHLQYESGNNYNDHVDCATRCTQFDEFQFKSVITGADGTAKGAVAGVKQSSAIPTRYGFGMKNWQQTPEGMYGGFNNAIVKPGAPLTAPFNGYTNYNHLATPTDPAETNNVTRVRVTWREPIFCSPFSSRYDATYGRPLYNITSMDLTFTMQSLGNMIRLMNVRTSSGTSADTSIASYTVHIVSADLCYQVMTIPPVLTKPLTTLVPYRRFVPYITDAPSKPAGNADTTIQISSGVYTFNEIPTAIWLFVAPSKRYYQGNMRDAVQYPYNAATHQQADDACYNGNWDCNKLFGFIQHVSISLANTTQILDTAKVSDLYRIAKANGCEDSYLSWSGYDTVTPRPIPTGNLVGANAATTGVVGDTGCYSVNWDSLKPLYTGAGSVLRLKPGVDLIIPDQALISGANANNMVFKADVTATIPKHGKVVPPSNIPEDMSYSLWLLFEYVGVAAISPGQCEITMNPLGSGEIMASSPVVSATSEATEGKLEGGGNGLWERILRALSIANQVAKETGIISRILKLIPGDKGRQVASFLERSGVGAPGGVDDMDMMGRGAKRARGGAVMGRGLQDWSV
jgi:hypothetical protein